MMKSTRREFLSKAAMYSLGALAFNDVALAETAKTKTISVGMIGTGRRGTSLLRTLLSIPDVQVRAVCDTIPGHLARAQDLVVQAGQQKPKGFGVDEDDWKSMLDEKNLDAVVIATPWELHTPMALHAMRRGIYAGVEVPIAYTLQECWDLVDTYEETGTPCMMLENWAFRRDNLAVLNMVREGLFGEIVHCHCAHSHDILPYWYFDRETGEPKWPAKYLLTHNRDSYPSHQMGPVISWMNLGTGDYPDTIVSMATNSFRPREYFRETFGADHPYAHAHYTQGDIVTSTIRTRLGKTIVVNYDMVLPRPYDNRWMLQGTRGLYQEGHDDYHQSPRLVYIDGVSPRDKKFELFSPYQEKYDHPWWRGQTAKGGHGGTDPVELNLFIDAVRQQTQTPLDIYDSILMCVHGPLSEESIAKGGAPVKVPDFTRGRWKLRKPTFGA